MKIFGGRGGLIGDSLMCLPLIPTLQSMYGDIDLTWPICRKCIQASPLYIDQPGIDSIYITRDEEWLNDAEHIWIKNKFDLFINPTPNHPREPDWYNYRNCVEETILMAGEQYFEAFQSLPKTLQTPTLKPLWEIKAKYQTVAIHTTAGYSKDKHRSPSTRWWNELSNKLIRKGFYILQFGHPNDEHIPCAHRIYNDLSLIEQIRLASNCQIYIGTDSGFSWAMGALGIKQISLITNWLPNHHSNHLALAPTNFNNLATNFYAGGGCDNIAIDDVVRDIVY